MSRVQLAPRPINRSDPVRQLAIERIVTEMLADCEVDALDTAGTWRLIAQMAIHALAEKHQRITRQHESISRLREELRIRMNVAKRTGR